MKKLLSVLFSIAFLLVFVSFFSQKSLATACPGTCTSPSNLSCPNGIYDGDNNCAAGSNPYSICCNAAPAAPAPTATTCKQGYTLQNGVCNFTCPGTCQADSSYCGTGKASDTFGPRDSSGDAYCYGKPPSGHAYCCDNLTSATCDSPKTQGYYTCSASHTCLFSPACGTSTGGCTKTSVTCGTTCQHPVCSSSSCGTISNSCGSTTCKKCSNPPAGPKPAAPVIGTPACLSATSETLNWTVDKTTTSTSLWYCDETKAAAHKPAVKCTRGSQATTDKTQAGWYFSIPSASSPFALTSTAVTGKAPLVTGDKYTWYVTATNASGSTDSSYNNEFTLAACTPVTCTLPQTTPFYTCSSSNTCVLNTACGTSSGGCTAAGGTCNIPVGDTTLTLTIGLDGIGHTGDNVNPAFASGTNTALINGTAVTSTTAGSNQIPLAQTRPLKVAIFDTGNKETDFATSMKYDSTTGLFDIVEADTTVDLGANWVSGSYTVKVSTDGHLVRLVPGPSQTITRGTTNALPRANLVAGDVDNSNALDILDYNILLSCIVDPTINNPDNGHLCATPDKNYAALSDLDNNGTIDNYDYNLFLREYSKQSGD